MGRLQDSGVDSFSLHAGLSGLADELFPKVSIIVASYNNEQTIEECLKSILALDYPAGFVEVIVMDGASKDGTVKKAEQFPVKVVSIRLNAPAAYNYAMKNVAANPILGFIDSDAKVEPQWLRKLVPRLGEAAGCGRQRHHRNLERRKPVGKKHRVRTQKPLPPHRQVHKPNRHHELAAEKGGYRGGWRMG